MPVLVLIMVAIVAALAGVAAYYLWQLKCLRQKQTEERAGQAEEHERRRESINKSILIIARAVGTEEITLTEASIRIAGLLDSLAVPETTQVRYQAFYQLRAATAHIPYLDAWKALDRKEQFRLERERERLEETHREFIEDAARRIQSDTF